MSDLSEQQLGSGQDIYALAWNQQRMPMPWWLKLLPRWAQPLIALELARRDLEGED